MIEWKQHVPSFCSGFDSDHKKFSTVRQFKEFLIERYNTPGGLCSGWSFCYEDDYTEDVGLLIHVNPSRDHWWVIGYVKLTPLQQKHFVDGETFFLHGGFEDVSSGKRYIQLKSLDNKVKELEQESDNMFDEYNKQIQVLTQMLEERNNEIDKLKAQDKLTDKVMRELYSLFTADYICGCVNVHKNEDASELVKRYAATLGVDL